VKGAYEGVPMQEPISWNSLPRAAEWLTGLTESQWDATRLLDHLVASDSPIKKDGSIEISLLKIVKVQLPREAVFAAIERNATPSKRKTDRHKHIATLYGSPPGDTDAYTDGPYTPPFCCLNAGHLRDLLLYPSLIIGSLKKNQIYYGGGQCETGSDLLWALPYPTQHVITINDCFIERDDLLSLGEQLCGPIVSNAKLVGGAQAADGNQAGDEVKHAQATETKQSSEEEYSDLFDEVHYRELATMFPTHNDPLKSAKDWQKFSMRKKRNGLKVAQVSNKDGMFNPYKAARWWIDERNPIGWDWPKCMRKLANSLPSRSKDEKHLLTGTFD